jgi:hypothetical protein
MRNNRAPRQSPFVPRLIRPRDARRYLGMDKNRFNHEVRPGLKSVIVTNSMRGQTTTSGAMDARGKNPKGASHRTW